jgi:hypothetical protein
MTTPNFTVDGSLTRLTNDGRIFTVFIADQCMAILMSVSTQCVDVNLVNLTYEELEKRLNGTLLRCSKHGKPDGVARIWIV